MAKAGRAWEPGAGKESTVRPCREAEGRGREGGRGWKRERKRERERQTDRGERRESSESRWETKAHFTVLRASALRKSRGHRGLWPPSTIHHSPAWTSLETSTTVGGGSEQKQEENLPYSVPVCSVGPSGSFREDEPTSQETRYSQSHLWWPALVTATKMSLAPVHHHKQGRVDSPPACLIDWNLCFECPSESHAEAACLCDGLSSGWAD